MAIVVAGEKSEKSEKVGGYSLDGLATCWDNDFLVRQRLRCGYNLVCKYDPSTGAPVSGHVEKSQDNCKINNFILSPVLCMMFQNDFKLPAIDQVQIHVGDIYQLNQVTVTEVQIYQDSWAIRRLLHYMKSMLYRPSFPKDITYFSCLRVSNTGDKTGDRKLNFCQSAFLGSIPIQFSQMSGSCSKLRFSEQQVYIYICVQAHPKKKTYK